MDNEVLNMTMNKIIFMGTATFSQAVLEKLIENDYQISLVVTQPDRLVGRKKELKMPEVKEVALKNGIPVFQPENIKKDYQMILDQNADLIITAAYGQIVPKAVLDAPRLGCINVHASLLPKYRGGAPVHQAIIDGEEKTGVTIMYMATKMDAGDIISAKEVPILNTDTVGILYDRLSEVGASLLIETLPSVLNGTNKRIHQDENLVTYAPTIQREQEHVDFQKSAFLVDCQIRGLNPWPGAYTTLDGKIVKLWQGHIHQCENAMKHHGHEENGTIIKVFKDAIGIKVEDGVYLLTEAQLEGKRRMAMKDILNGKHPFEVGKKFK